MNANAVLNKLSRNCQMQPVQQGNYLDSLKARQPWWLALCFAIVGLGVNWYCAFEWFSGKYSLIANPVLSKLGLISVFSALISFFLVRVLQRARLRDFPAAFLLVS